MLKKAINYFKKNGFKALIDRIMRPVGLYFFCVFRFRKVLKFLSKNLTSTKSYIKLRAKYYNKCNTGYTLENNIPTKKIFWCWLQGEENAPLLCKKCLQSLRRQFTNYEIVVVTDENMFSLVKIPDYIVEKYKKGIITRTHFSDILRTALIVEHGGVWIDSTVFCTGYNTPVFDYPMFVFQDWKFDLEQPVVASSWFISAFKGHPILRSALDLLYDYWTNHNYLENYFLFHLFFKMATERYSELWKQVPRFSNIPPHILQFEMFDRYSEERFEQIKKMSDFHKLTYKHPKLSDGEVDGLMVEKVMKNE